MDMASFTSLHMFGPLGRGVKVGHEFVKPWFIWSSGLGSRHQASQDSAVWMGRERQQRENKSIRILNGTLVRLRYQSVTY